MSRTCEHCGKDCSKHHTKQGPLYFCNDKCKYIYNVNQEHAAITLGSVSFSPEL